MFEEYRAGKLVAAQYREGLSDEFVQEVLRTLDRIWFALSGIQKLPELVQQMSVVIEAVKPYGGLENFLRIAECLNEDDVRWFNEHCK